MMYYQLSIKLKRSSSPFGCHFQDDEDYGRTVVMMSSKLWHSTKMKNDVAAYLCKCYEEGWKKIFKDSPFSQKSP